MKMIQSYKQSAQIITNTRDLGEETEEIKKSHSHILFLHILWKIRC